MGSFTSFRMTKKNWHGILHFVQDDKKELAWDPSGRALRMTRRELRSQDDRNFKILQCVRDDNGRRRNFSQKNSAAFFNYSLFTFNQLIF